MQKIVLDDGTYAKVKVDISGKKYNLLTVIKPFKKDKNGTIIWLCKCDCGKDTYVSKPNLESGNTKSCGCLNHKKIENPRKKDRLYHVWHGMKERCSKKANVINSKWYSEKGIDVCDEWKHDFISFKKWMIDNGYDYSKSRKEQSLDRIDSNKGYSPDNCRIITHSENCRNTSRNVMITYKGETKTLIEWVEQYNLNYKLVQSRIIHGYSPEDAFFKKTFDLRKNKTGVKGVSMNNYGLYVFRWKHKYIGARKTLEEIIKLKEEYLNGVGC